MKLSIISFNTFAAPFFAHKIIRSMFRTRVKERLQIVAENLKKENPDVILLQELFTYLNLQFVKKLLPDYALFYRPFIYGPRGGLVVFSKLPIRTIQYIDFEEKGSLWNKSLTGPITKKGMLVAYCQSLPLTIINTHLTQNSDHDWSDNNRYTKILIKQLHQITQEIKKIKNTNVILAGDFNMPKTTHLYSDFLHITKLKDPFSHYQDSTYHTDMIPFYTPKRREDYIFFQGDGLKCIQTSELFRGKFLLADGTRAYLSDHIALKAQFELSA